MNKSVLLSPLNLSHKHVGKIGDRFYARAICELGASRFNFCLLSHILFSKQQIFCASRSLCDFCLCGSDKGPARFVSLALSLCNYRLSAYLEESAVLCALGQDPRR